VIPDIVSPLILKRLMNTTRIARFPDTSTKIFHAIFEKQGGRIEIKHTKAGRHKEKENGILRAFTCYNYY
jgi:hypothetical protein